MLNLFFYFEHVAYLQNDMFKVDSGVQHAYVRFLRHVNLLFFFPTCLTCFQLTCRIHAFYFTMLNRLFVYMLASCFLFHHVKTYSVTHVRFKFLYRPCSLHFPLHVEYKILILPLKRVSSN